MHGAVSGRTSRPGVAESAPPSPGTGRRPERTTLSLLLLALSTLFLCSMDKGYFYHLREHNSNTGGNLAIAENLSPDHRFRLFRGLHQESGGAPIYEMYGRFPVGGYALIKLAILPFGNDLSARILAARMLMLLLFSGAALLAFHSLARITSRRWVALAATLTAFSSCYMLFYSNGVSVEYGVDLFAVMLVFHGMVVFVQEGRFPQLLAKTCLALLLGWRAYAFLTPFILLGLAREAVRAWKGGTAVWLRPTAAALLRSRYAALGLAALLFGMAVLSFNLANEYTAFEGEIAVTELLVVKSMLRRTGLNQALEAHEWWLRFLRQQFFRVCVASVPLALTDWGAGLLESFLPVQLSASGISGPKLPVYLLFLLLLLVAVASSTVVVRLARSLLSGRSRMLLATLALSGFFWTLPMRHNAYHAHEALYYVGIPLVFYSLLLLYVHKRWGHRPVVGLSVAALLAFVISAFQTEQRWRQGWRPAPRAVEFLHAAMSELGTIRETTRGKVVMVLGSVEPEWSWQLTHQGHEWRYLLAGSVLAYPFHTGPFHTKALVRIGYYPPGSTKTHFPDMEDAARAADFILTFDRVESDALLTPGNERAFLYDSAGIDDLAGFYRATYQRVASGDPAARSDFDVYLDDGALFHVKDPCVPEDAGYAIFVDVVPEDPKDLPGWRRRYGFEKLRTLFPHSSVLFEGKCMAILPLPDYPISSIRTGQEPSRNPAREGHRGWKVEFGSLRRPGSPPL